MNANLRKALYALVPIIVATLTTYGLLTQQLGVLWGNVATLGVGFGYAASKATGNRLLDPGVRRAGYVLIPAVVALVGGYVTLDAGLWTSLVLAIVGAVYAIGNVDPDEQIETVYNPVTDSYEPVLGDPASELAELAQQDKDKRGWDGAPDGYEPMRLDDGPEPKN